MVVIDDHRNGWRHLVVPMAHVDELVRDAVLSTSAFHFSANVNDQLFNSSAMYQKAIHRLRQRQNLEAHGTTEKQAVVVALLVLLAAVMVNGSTDFHTIFRLLETALCAIGGEEALVKGELGVFLLRQIWK
jgi:Fungal specific transcription factor domain